MANAQTKATKKYQAKMGLIRKSFTTHQTTANQFKKACEIAGVSQNAALDGFMKEFIAKYLPEEKIDD